MVLENKTKNWYIKYICFIAIVLTIWSYVLFSNKLWFLFESNWFISVTMLFGSFIAGATSEGGGAVVFPIMTLCYKISPLVARDFSLMIQSVGMMSAALVIVLTKIDILKKIIVCASIGSFFGIPFGLEISYHMEPAIVKFFFVSLWMGFINVLIFVKNNNNSNQISSLSLKSKNQILVAIALGFLGGVITGILGSGIDILIFAYVVLRHGVSEKIATPTSVVLMAINSVFGVFWLNSALFQGVDPQAFEYFMVSVPIVILGAPFGAIFITKKSKEFIKKFLIISITIQFITALFIIQHTILSISIGITTLIVSTIFFNKMKKDSNFEKMESSS